MCQKEVPPPLPPLQPGSFSISDFDDSYSSEEDQDEEDNDQGLDADRPPPYPGRGEYFGDEEEEDPDAVLDEHWELGLDDDGIQEGKIHRRIAEKMD